MFWVLQGAHAAGVDQDPALLQLASLGEQTRSAGASVGGLPRVGSKRPGRFPWSASPRVGVPVSPGLPAAAGWRRCPRRSRACLAPGVRGPSRARGARAGFPSLPRAAPAPPGLGACRTGN